MCFIAIVEYGLLRLPDKYYGLMAGVTGQQRMLTPPRHLIPPLVFAQLLFLYCIWDLI